MAWRFGLGKRIKANARLEALLRVIVRLWSVMTKRLVVSEQAS
jgi:hypothetical protein